VEEQVEEMANLKVRNLKNLTAAKGNERE